MSDRYCKMIVRVHPELPARLLTMQERLFQETLHEYSNAAIVRGLINLGLIQVEGAPNLAPLFVGARVKRGRKPGGKVATTVAKLDLTDEPDEDMDLEYEDEFNAGLLPKPKEEVVARERMRRRRHPLRDAAKRAAKPTKRAEEEDEEEDDDDPTDPGMDLDNADTADGEPDP